MGYRFVVSRPCRDSVVCYCTWHLNVSACKLAPPFVVPGYFQSRPFDSFTALSRSGQALAALTADDADCSDRRIAKIAEIAKKSKFKRGTQLPDQSRYARMKGD